MIVQILIYFVIFELGICLGFFIAGLTHAAKEGDKTVK